MESLGDLCDAVRFFVFVIQNEAQRSEESKNNRFIGNT
jgi:hypothetical protein